MPEKDVALEKVLANSHRHFQTSASSHHPIPPHQHKHQPTTTQKPTMPPRKNFLFESLATSFGNRYNSEADTSPSPTEAIPAHHTIVLGLPGHERIQDAAEQAQLACARARMVEDGKRRIAEGACACRDPNRRKSCIWQEDDNDDEVYGPALAAAIFATFSREKDEAAAAAAAARLESSQISVHISTTSITTAQQLPPVEDCRESSSSSSVLAALSEWWSVHNTKDPIDLAFLKTSNPEHKRVLSHKRGLSHKWGLPHEWRLSSDTSRADQEP